MTALVIGGAASGKSEFAEELTMKLTLQKKIYIATMQPYDEECLRRIEKHRAMRKEKNFDTVECYRDLSSVRVPKGSTVLLECMSNLCANEFFGPDRERAEQSILSGVSSLAAQCGHLVIVSNEVFSGGCRYEGETLDYMKLLGRINCRLAQRADRVCELVCGIPVWHKGGEA